MACPVGKAEAEQVAVANALRLTLHKSTGKLSPPPRALCIQYFSAPLLTSFIANQGFQAP